jgi:C-terminal processing protease CtpA/Prc
MDYYEYRFAMIKLTARIHDGHGKVWHLLNMIPPTGPECAPLLFRFVEDKLVVTGYAHEVNGPATGVEVGDEIHRIDGISVETLLDSLRVFYGASKETSLRTELARGPITRGEGPITLGGVGESGAFEVSFPRVLRTELDLAPGYVNVLPGPTFQMLDEDVAYLKLTSIIAADVPTYIEQAQAADVLVIDLRGFPAEPVAKALGGHLVVSPEPFARFAKADRTNPGAFVCDIPQTLLPSSPPYQGKVVILVDETTGSQGEHTAMAFRVAPEAIVVGSTTWGADGTLTRIPLPGDVESAMSGVGVFYPDKTPTQRIGIIPDLEVRPTIAGIREGRDEVLEAGVSYALGRDFTGCR